MGRSSGLAFAFESVLLDEAIEIRSTQFGSLGGLRDLELVSLEQPANVLPLPALEPSVAEFFERLLEISAEPAGVETSNYWNIYRPMSDE